MRTGFAFLVPALLAGVAALAPATSFRVAGVLGDRPQLGCCRNMSGFQVRLNVSPLVGSKSASKSGFKVTIGITNEDPTGRSSADLWALYE